MTVYHSNKLLQILIAGGVVRGPIFDANIYR
jgi:hypothetical protein